MLSHDALCVCPAYIHTLLLTWKVYEKYKCPFSESFFTLFQVGSDDRMIRLKSREGRFAAFSFFWE